MFDPGYYKTNYRALRFRELVRMQGMPRAFLGYFITRFKRFATCGRGALTLTKRTPLPELRNLGLHSLAGRNILPLWQR